LAFRNKILGKALRSTCQTTATGAVALQNPIHYAARVMSKHAKRALVTGGAGLIGSHVTDLLLREGWKVRLLDNLEPNTHKRGKPAWINQDAEFIAGDLRDRDSITAALDNIDIVFHQAAYGGYMPEIAKYVHVNSLGTAQMLEVIREKKLPIKKFVVASSQAVYSEGAGECPEHGLVFPPVRPVEQLRKGDWQVHCPICGAITKSVPTPENAPVGGETVYGLTKVDQERLVLLWGKQIGIPTVALRYSCTYGPRQSIFNPYTGVIAIFCTRLLNNLPPVLYEDGEQTRDFSFVEDIARANLLAVETDKLDGLPVNVGRGRGVSIREIAETISNALEIDIVPEAKGEFRPGEMRHLTSDTTRVRAAGYEPHVDLAEGIRRYIDWIRTQSDIRDYFSEAAKILRSKGIVHRVKVMDA
jgi:dTDP-L-rhamnose 4-epimerase